MEVLQLENERRNRIQTGRRGRDGDGLVPHPSVADKNQEGYLRFRGPLLSSTGFQVTQRPPAQDISARKISPYKFWLQKPVGIEAEDDENSWSPRQFLIKGPHTDLLGLTLSKLEHEAAA